MTTRLTLVCHAATPATRASAFPADEALDPRWLPRLASLAGALGRNDRASTSPALRARQTAQGLGLVAGPEALLRDCDYGRWAGRAIDDIAAHEPESIAEWLRDPAAAPHGGESIVDVIGRVALWLDGQGSGPERAVAVTHAAIIKAAIIHAIGATPRSFWRIDVAPLSATRLNGRAGQWTLSSIGRLSAPRA